MIISKNKSHHVIFVLVMLCLFITAAFAEVSREQVMPKPVAEEMFSSSGITWIPNLNFPRVELTITRPDGSFYQHTFEGGSNLYADLSSICGQGTNDGLYTYELRVAHVPGKITRKEDQGGIIKHNEGHTLTQTGYITIRNGMIINSNQGPEINRVQDIVHEDDVIIHYSLCVGTDCINGEDFGYDTIRLKENNLRIHFDDTSSIAGYSSNDWRLVANSSDSGGAGYLAIQDATASRTVFLVEAGAPSNALYVDDRGDVGLGTSTPIYDFHIKRGDSPAIRMEQDTSYGWTAQTWDLSGNESNFFIRDATNGSKLPFRIQPAAPTNSIYIKNDGKIGMGTSSPAASLEVQTTSIAADILLERTDGASAEVSARQNRVTVGSLNDFNLEFLANNSTKMTITTSGNVGIGTSNPSHKIEVYNAGGTNAYCDGGTWVNGSSRSFKTNVKALSSSEAFNTLQKLNPVRFKYKGIEEEEYLGFIAEDVPDLVAMKDRKGMSPMDIVAILTKVAQQQQNTINLQNQTISALEKRIDSLEKQIQNKN